MFRFFRNLAAGAAAATAAARRRGTEQILH